MEQNKNKAFATLDGVRLSDLRMWHVVTAICARCRWANRVAYNDLRRGIPLDTPLLDLAYRLRCARCRYRGADNRFNVTMPGG